MPLPQTNFFKKDTSSNFHLGCLRIGDIRVAIEDGWSVTGYRIDYGPTINTGFFAGYEPITGNAAGNPECVGQLQSLGASWFGYLVNFTGNSPSFTYVGGGNSSAYTNMVQVLSGTSTETVGFWGLTGICQQRTPKNCIFMEYNLFPMVTSGLTSYFNWDWAYCRNRTGLTGNTQPRALDLSHYQNTAYYTTGRPSGQGTVRSFVALQMDGVQANLTMSGTTPINIFTGTDFTWFLYHNVSIPGAPGGNQYIWTSVSGAQKNFAIKYVCATTVNCSMVIETPTTSYSSTTTGTNFNGFSSSLPQAYFPNSYGTTRQSVLRKSGSTFDLFWNQGGTPYSGLTKMWTVTINDWSVAYPTIPFYLYYNPQLEYYTSGSLQSSTTYNRALSDKEIELTLSGLNYNVNSCNFDPTFPQYPT